MIITCTACDKKFVVPDNAIPASGRTVQCSSCSNQWKQFPIKIEQAPIKTKQTPIQTKTIAIQKKSKKKKASTPAPYSKEYMEQKWGTTIKNYTKEKGLSKKTKALPKTNKSQKQKSNRTSGKIGFGFFNYIITISVFSIFLIGILNFERSRLSRKFPFLEPYINNFFETLENFQIFILDFFR